MPSEVSAALSTRWIPHCLDPYGCLGASLDVTVICLLILADNAVTKLMMSWRTMGDGALSQMSM